MKRSLFERLTALEQSVRAANSQRAEAEAMPEPAPTGSLEDLGFLRDGRYGGFWCRELRYDLLTLHGTHRFAEILTAPLEPLFRAARSAERPPDSLRFYDAETTGLGTGAGTIPFLHAVAELDADELLLCQYFLADYAEETALLQAMAERHFSRPCTVVSFNGKSYDWPLLKSRYDLYRMAAPVVDHVDLLHPARRLWQSSLGRVSLQAVESSLLDLHRLADLPGREAPARYFRYVETGSVDEIEPVLQHNASDVLSLVSLTVALANRLSRRTPPQSAAELAAIGRYHQEWQQSDVASRCFAEAAEFPDAGWLIHWLRAIHHKRLQEWETATAVWREMAERYPWSVPPVVELAKYYEHRAKDYETALRWADEALQRTLSDPALRGGGVLPAQVEPLIAALRRRRSRILQKLDTLTGR